ncbi:hypothetical protein [Amycolatopsis keratiniphila]|uniref:Uncharacterized protein n=1 Tax=Amycolatopsis keratiniphila subsp. keratiniphila TaxID=227715 RepID=A0A1W2M0L4_9PSEU|nr:hypothetical protein [Amycolatopsis keratiniphila]ONF73157.1 hypothetical protein AVR91_0207760 [Amycolatopsis keratiniphila subsp. keratiniphila]
MRQNSEVERVALDAAMKVWSGFPSGHRESFAFETGYSNNYRADYKSNPDWLAALGWFDFQISGVVTPTSDGGYDITYQVSIYDYYNWESTGWRPWRQASDLNDLHRAGWAQNFDVIGRSSPRTFHVPPS